VHLQDAYSGLSHGRGDFREAEAWANECVSLPMFAELLPEHLEQVIQGVRSFGLAQVPQLNKH
jgi:dTDP-4-amino-4,6-dideoxygalactose transaminase